MKHPDIAPGVLDEMVQRVIASLEQGRERVSLMAEAAGAACSEATLAVTVLQQELQELQVQGVNEQVNQVMERLDQLGQVATDSARVSKELSDSIQSVAINFRSLSRHLESAQQSRALGLHVIRAQEEERRRLAREIHDGPTQLLNSVVLRIDVCQRFFDSDLERLRGELQQLKELVRLSLQDVRKIIFDLRPMTLDDLGLLPALRTFLKDYEAKTGIETDLVTFGEDRRYDSTFEVAIFRIVQEALTNVYKHAGAIRVWVKIEATSGRELKLQIRDDGVGFEADQVSRGVGGAKFGLVAMRERTELLGGLMEVQSANLQGTELNFIFPLGD